MNFSQLHENLRQEILRRIDRGLLSGSSLARVTGFRHAHISNFLNSKRSLSLEGMDRVLSAENLSVLDLLPAQAIAAQPAPSKSSASLVHTVPVVTHTAAISEARIASVSILESIDVADSVLHLSHARPSAGRQSWQRFVAIRADAEHAAAMDPIVQPTSVVVIDRHYHSLAHYRPLQPTLYAVHMMDRLHICFLSFESNRLVLRPRNHNYPVRLVELSIHEQPTDRIVGRICYIASEY